MLAQTPPTVMYDIKAILRPLKGHAYLGFTCEACGHSIAMINDPGRGRTESLAPASVVEVRCPNCHVVTRQSTAALMPFTA